LRQLKARGFRIVHVIPGKPAPQPPDDSAKVMLASVVAPPKLPLPRLLSNDADSVAAIAEKALQIASLGVTHSGPHSKSEPTAKHIRPSKPQKTVQTATLMPDRFDAGALR